MSLWDVITVYLTKIYTTLCGISVQNFDIKTVGSYRYHYAIECESCDVLSSSITVYLTSSVSCSHSLCLEILWWKQMSAKKVENKWRERKVRKGMEKPRTLSGKKALCNTSCSHLAHSCSQGITNWKHFILHWLLSLTLLWGMYVQTAGCMDHGRALCIS